MALPYNAYSQGMALQRKLASDTDTAANWTHITWVNGPQDMVVDLPTAGYSYNYRLCIIMGSQYQDSTLSVAGRQTLVAANIKR